MKRLLLFCLAIVGAPLVWVFGYCFLKTLAVDLLDAPFWTYYRTCFISGCVVMFGLYATLGRRFSVLYVFAHEMTHAIVGLLCFARIHCMSIRETGGLVQLSKTNLAITLSPYCVPFYLLIGIGCYGLQQLLVPDLIPFSVWSFLFGMATVFHVCFTADALLSVSQPDTHEYGRLFSWWLILVTNLFFALVALTVTSPRYTLLKQGVQVVQETYSTYHVIYQKGYALTQHVMGVIVKPSSASKSTERTRR